MGVLVKYCRKVGRLGRWGGWKTIRLGRNDGIRGAGAAPADLRMYTLPRGIRQRDHLRSDFS